MLRESKTSNRQSWKISHSDRNFIADEVIDMLDVLKIDIAYEIYQNNLESTRKTNPPEES